MLGKIVGIYTAPAKGEPMQARKRVHAIAQRGLEGDRYESRTGAYSHTDRIPDEDRQISLIAVEGIDEGNANLAKEGVAPFSWQETRRNLIVEIEANALNDLVGKIFTVGSIAMEGVELCAPCERPSGLVKKPGFMKAYDNRGGLRARILNDGDIAIGDEVSLG